jgi:hypothetical protein
VENYLHGVGSGTAFVVLPSCVLKRPLEKAVSESIQVLRSIVVNSDACRQWGSLECGVVLLVSSKLFARSQTMFGMLEMAPRLLKVR